jgi:pyridoxal phosphate enzyme (YggS family)
MSVAENIARIREGFGNHPVKLIAVTKSAQIPQIEEAFATGITEFGENRVQDALSRIEQLSSEIQQKVSWHFIGHLQTNKAKQVVGRFALIHSVDSVKLAAEISKSAQAKGLVQQILLQVKILPDPSKSGFSAEELKADFISISKLPNIEVCGLMTITPLEAERDEKIACFSGLRELRDELQMVSGIPLRELSMGMSDDWQQAVACGATMVRIGSAIFRQ